MGRHENPLTYTNIKYIYHAYNDKVGKIQRKSHKRNNFTHTTLHNDITV